MRRSAATVAVGVTAWCLITAACGQKGPPLAPLHLVPAAVTDMSVRRVADHARLRFVLPTKNANGPGRLDLDRVEVFAVTVAPGAPPPPNRDFLTSTYLVGEIAVRPMPEEGQPRVDDDKRPEPGTTVTFAEELTPAKLTPAITKKADPTPEPVVPATTGTTPPTPPAPTDPVRIYAVAGVTKSGRHGPPSARVQIPVAALPPPPTELSARFTETNVALAWKPATETVTAYNVYSSAEPMQPLNREPLTTPSFEREFTKFGEPQCFRVRSVTMAGAVSIEGDLSDEECLTPVDTFPPASPKGLALVPTAGQISLIWDANSEKDLAGYLVLRGDAPNGPLKAVTPAPIRETSFRDTTVTPGTRYIYAIVAVDTATPANTSAESPRVEETAR